MMKNWNQWFLSFGLFGVILLILVYLIDCYFGVVQVDLIEQNFYFLMFGMKEILVCMFEEGVKLVDVKFFFFEIMGKMLLKFVKDFIGYECYL